LSAKILYVQNGNPMLLVFEDLASLSFRMADRLSGLDLDHSLLAFRGLARFHAASVVLCEKVNHVNHNQLQRFNAIIKNSDQWNESKGH